MLIDKYFQLKRRGDGPSKTGLLHLPKDIRRRIYLNAGLVSQYPIYLNYLPKENTCVQEYPPDFPETWPNDEESVGMRSKSLSHFLDGPLPHPKIQLERLCGCSQDQTESHPCQCFPFPYQLLYVSRITATEVSDIFYSENHFVAFRDRIGGLATLGSLSKKTLSRFTSLSIQLNVVEGRLNLPRRVGIDEYEEFLHCHEMCRVWNKKRYFMKEKKWTEHAALKEWGKLWKILKPKINQERLKLYVSCDTADPELAEEFLQPLVSTPCLQLRECSIRLGTSNSPYGELPGYSEDTFRQLFAIARRAAEDLTRKRPTSAFRYGDLPKEIRLQIMENSDLVTPYDLTWAPNPREATEPQKSKFYEHRRRDEVSSICCAKCSPFFEGVCSCFFRCAGFSTTCTCWDMPQYFLVDHKMREDAEQVFYNKNHFLILPAARGDNLRIQEFLTQLSNTSLRYLRSLSISGPGIYQWFGATAEDDFLVSKNGELVQWGQCLSIINNKMNPGQLQLTIHLGFDKENIGYRLGSPVRHVPDEEYISEAEKAWKFAKVLADLFLKQKRLRDLFLHFKWPFEDYAEAIPQDRGMLLEKMVMGEDYDGIKSGKNERRHRWNGYRCGENNDWCSACSDL